MVWETHLHQIHTRDMETSKDFQGQHSSQCMLGGIQPYFPNCLDPLLSISLSSLINQSKIIKSDILKSQFSCSFGEQK